MTYTMNSKKAHDKWLAKHPDKKMEYIKRQIQTRDRAYFKEYYIKNKSKYLFKREWLRMCKIDIL